MATTIGIGEIATPTANGSRSPRTTTHRSQVCGCQVAIAQITTMFRAMIRTDHHG